MSSIEIEKSLETARKELQETERLLLESKAIFIEELRIRLPNELKNIISEIIGRSADRIQVLPTGEVAKMKAAIEAEKAKAIEKAVSILQKTDWLAANGKSIDFPGLVQRGPIWIALQDYSTELRKLLESYGLKVDREYYGGERVSPFVLHIPFSTEKEKKEKLQEADESVGKAYRRYSDTKARVENLEERLKQAQAQEKYDSA